MANEKKSGELCVHVTDIPPEGVDMKGEVAFSVLDIEEDELTRLERPVAYSLHLVQLGADLLVTGSLDAEVSLMCDRCAEFSVHQLHTDDVCHRYENVAGEVVDLTEGLREDILIAFPQTHLCSEDCKGVCPKCGHNLNEGDCGCVLDEFEDVESEEDEASENPWAALDGLKL